ncbi:hypothetical protein KUP86_005172 [Salmonella enterica]|nr:hypothetical protein [Salmonella enterica]
MKKQGCFYPGIYVGAGVVFFRGAVMNMGDVLAPDNPLQNSVVTTEGVVHFYRVVKMEGVSETSVVYSGYFLNTRSG